MENYPEKPTNKLERIYFLLQLLLAVSISVPVKIHLFGYTITAFIGYVILALGLSWIAMGGWEKKWKQLQSNPLSLLFLFYYVVLIIGYLYSENKNEAKFILEKNLGMFVLPLIILSGPKISEKNALNIGKAFILGCGMISLLALLKGLYLTFKYGKQFLGNGETYFYYKVLSNLAGIHSTYLSLFVCFSVFLIGIHTYQNWKSLKTFNIIFRIFLMLYFLFFMYLLSTRMAYISFFIISFSLSLYHFYKKGKLVWGILILGLSFTVIIYVFSNLWHTRMRFYYMFHPNTEEWKGAETRNELLNRKVHWGCYLEAVSSGNLLFGVGTGDNWNAIVPCYTKWDFQGLKLKYNAHNQFIETLLRHGLLGISVWLVILLVPLWLSVKRKNVYYAVFIILFSLSCLTETFLDRQHGVVFFGFFNAVLFSFYFIKEKSVQT